MKLVTDEPEKKIFAEDVDVRVMDTKNFLYNLTSGLVVTLGHQSPPLPCRTRHGHQQ
jgi:hypothetical protein